MGRQSTGWLGLRDYQLRVVDWHWPRGNIDFSDSPAPATKVANVHQSLRGSDDAIRGRASGHVSDLPPRPAVACVLAVPLPEHNGNLAAISQPPDVGRVRCFDLCNGVSAVLVHWID